MMDFLTVIALAGLVLATVPAVLTAWNLLLYRRPRPAAGGRPAVSLLIPARDEADNIVPALEAALASRGVDLEILVADDGSTDGTGRLVEEVAVRDGRVRLLRPPPPPRGWAGKMHACQLLAEAASAPVLVFADADVRLAPDALARAAGFLESSGADLVSGVPRQLTGSLAERLLIPLIHQVLLGYLPLAAMRGSTSPAFAAGCGQLVVVRRTAYARAGGHAAVRATFHDGIALPRAFRRAGLRTDLMDATPLASCRMYEGPAAVVAGLAKNAHEGLGTPIGVWVWSALLLGGGVLPPALALYGLLAAPGAAFTAIAGAGWAVTLLHRLVLALRFSQPLIGTLLHPLGVIALVAIQWYARVARRSGAGVRWKGRAAPAGGLALAVVLAAAASAADGTSTPLTVELVGVEPGRGEVAVAVFADERSFERRSDAVSKVRLRASGPLLVWEVGELPPGTYAVAAWQDLDDDGDLARGAFGIPVEPWGVSADGRRALGPPRFGASSFRLPPGGRTIRIEVR